MLPNLPKIHTKKEADFGLKFRTWILKKDPKMPSGNYELKDSRGKEWIPFAEITTEQIDSAYRSEKENLIRVVVGTPGAPDYIYQRHVPTFFVIKFPKSAEVISLGSYLLERGRSNRKSLTSERAKAISTVSFK